MSADPRKFALVAVPRPGISSLFYKNPAFLNCSKGDCVEIELKKLKIWGVVEDFRDELPQGLDEEKIKPILGRICASPVFADKGETVFLKWVADYYMYPFHKLLKQIFLPWIGSDNALIGDSSPDHEVYHLKHPSASEEECDAYAKNIIGIPAYYEAVRHTKLLMAKLARQHTESEDFHDYCYQSES